MHQTNYWGTNCESYNDVHRRFKIHGDRRRGRTGDVAGDQEEVGADGAKGRAEEAH